MHRVIFRSQLFPVKLACDCCRYCRALYGTQEGFWDTCTYFVKSRHCANACCCLQVRIVPPAESLCRLRDMLDLHLPPHTQHQGSSSHSPATVHKLQLHPDLSAPDRCYAVQSNGGYTPWSCFYDLSASRCHASRKILSLLPSCT